MQKLIWLNSVERTNGVMHYIGKSQSGQIMSVYSVIRFFDGKDSVWFNGSSNMFFDRGEVIPVIYPKEHPSEAKIDNFVSVWGDTVAYAGIPGLILLIVFIHPEIIPRKARIKLTTGKPYLTILEA
ncbi:hypothetical protein [Flavihumibacter petaseus]|uniref:hypothetical protein n=1 Tax=Flavihumibacter petaseus TaxID=549295 RepID=UPI0012FAB31E|nr:hypothetical protein [Flavihumibacter petaseus]